VTVNIQKSEFLHHFLERKLNDAQKNAVVHSDGPLLIIAGAGSGKTRVITARIAKLILIDNVAPSSILALTFTNKAAHEMKERIKTFLSDTTKELPFVGTFHSFCVLILKKYSHLLEKPFFSILDEADQEKIVKNILKKMGIEKRYTARSLIYTISSIKNKMLHPRKPVLSELPAQLQEVYVLYEREKSQSYSYDFDDLLLEVLHLFTTNEEFRIKFQLATQHVLVDEYQDTNIVQHELLKKISLSLGEKHFAIASLCAVGDEDQSIYKWRGAEVENVQKFEKDFPKTVIIKIEQNYRSTQFILDVANDIIVNNKSRIKKKLYATKKGKTKPLLITCASDYQEAAVIVQTIIATKKIQPSYTQAVLYRAHVQSRLIEEELLKNSIPYVIIGGTQFYERKEIKDLIAYLRIIVNPYDKAAFFRILNIPGRGFGPKTEEILGNSWNNQPLLSCTEFIEYVIKHEDFSSNKKEALQQFLDIFKDLNGSMSASAIFSHILTKTNYNKYIVSEYEKDEAQTRLDNIEELRRAIEHFKTVGHDTISSVVHEIALLQDKAFEQQENKTVVFLMTLHASKGLEFDVVFIPGIEEGMLPSQRSFSDPSAVEEERRLLYVGCTRAREILILSHAQYRYTYTHVSEQKKSRFLYEISPDSVVIHNTCYNQKTEISLLIKNIGSCL